MTKSSHRSHIIIRIDFIISIVLGGIDISYSRAVGMYYTNFSLLPVKLKRKEALQVKQTRIRSLEEMAAFSRKKAPGLGASSIHADLAPPTLYFTFGMESCYPVAALLV